MPGSPVATRPDAASARAGHHFRPKVACDLSGRLSTFIACRRRPSVDDTAAHSLKREAIDGKVPNGDIALVVEARARLNSFDFRPRLDDGEELFGIRFRADFFVAEAIDEPLDEAPLPNRTLLHAG